jgi:uncharacterized protein (TIGR02266 family)
MESYSSLLEAFEALNERKRKDPKSLSDKEKAQWMEMRREIEEVLFQAKPDPATDTRQFLRVPVALAVRYWTRDELKDRYIHVLGEGGLFVSTVDPLPVGSEMDLEVELAQKGTSFKVKGQVVWVNEGEDHSKRGMGIKFSNLTYDQKRYVYGLVDDTLRQHLLERRRFARVDARLKVKFVFAEGFFELRTEDLSLGGLFIATDHLVPVGEKVRLVLQVPGVQPPVKAVAEVVRVVEDATPGQPAGLGVRFLELTKEGLSTIQQFLGAQVSGEVEPIGLERRRYPRVERLVKLSFNAKDYPRTSYARDISTGGVFIHTHDPLPQGTEVEVTLIHPVTTKKLVLSGRIVRVVEANPERPAQVPGVGVAFEEVSEEKRKTLREFLKDFALLESSKALPEEDQQKEPEGE